jgi:hypothetical protein
MPALRQQERRAALVSIFRHHVEKERLKGRRVTYLQIVTQPPDTLQKRECGYPATG